MWQVTRARCAANLKNARAARPRRERARDGGAALLEFALVAPLFFFVVFAGIELGLMFRTHLTVEDVSRNAARVASVERADVDADRAILERISSSVSTLNGDVTRIVVFNVDTLSDDVPADCLTGSSRSRVCNVYTPVDGDVAALAAGPLETALLAEDRGQLQNLGVYIEYEYRYVTGFLDRTTLTASSVEVVELNL